MKLTATKESKESGTLQYGTVPKDQVGQSFVYKKPDEQTIATFKLANADEMNLNINVHLKFISTNSLHPDLWQRLRKNFFFFVFTSIEPSVNQHG